MVCRVSPSFVRFGSFQLPALRGGDQLPLVRALADHVIRHHYPHLQGVLFCPASFHGKSAVLPAGRSKPCRMEAR